MESQISKIYAPSNAAGRQLTITKSDVSAESRRAAVLDGTHHPELEQTDVTAVGMTPRGPVVAEDVRDLQS